MSKTEKPVDDGEFETLKANFVDVEKDGIDIVELIAKHTKAARQAMRNDSVDTLTLSNELVELSIMLQRFADREANMGYVHRWAKEYYERIRENHKIRLVRDDKIAAGVADSMKVELSKNEFQIYNETEQRMDQFRLARRATEKTLDAIRSKLSYEKANEQRA